VAAKSSGTHRCPQSLGFGRWRAEIADDRGVQTVTLWRPVGQADLDLTAQSGWTRFPPRLPGQPIFYRVLNEAYATKIAGDRATSAACCASRSTGVRGTVRAATGGIHELWIPAEQLEEFNDHIVGRIELVSEHRPRGFIWLVSRE
jgi:hypothetical protein